MRLTVGLTRKEHGLALFLFSNAGRLISAGHLLDMVWRRRAGVAVMNPRFPHQLSRIHVATAGSIAATVSSWWRCNGSGYRPTGYWGCAGGAAGAAWRAQSGDIAPCDRVTA